MPHSLKQSLLVVAALFVVACSGTQPQQETDSRPATTEQQLGSLPLGADCYSDNDCASGLCADLHTSQTYWPWCYGRICTEHCEGVQSGDAYCQSLAEEAGAPNPEYASCAAFGYETYTACDLAAAGMGTVGCE